MLKARIISTLRFFALQEVPLTLFELHKYLLADLDAIKSHLGPGWEVSSIEQPAEPVSPGRIMDCLESECGNEVRSFRGYYYLKDWDDSSVTRRLHNYLYAVRRERIIKKYTPGLRYLPFLRSVALVGSQALGLPKTGSDIDLLIIVEPGFMWLARVFVTLYFQMAGVRRHGRKVADRFCPNHYLAGPKKLGQDRNLYTASEYLKARPIYHAAILAEFKQRNWPWLRLFFPNAGLYDNTIAPQPLPKRLLEAVLSNKLGRWLDAVARAYQSRRISRSEFVVVESDEMSFYPENRKAQLFRAFFEHQQ